MSKITSDGSSKRDRFDSCTFLIVDQEFGQGFKGVTVRITRVTDGYLSSKSNSNIS